MAETVYLCDCMYSSNWKWKRIYIYSVGRSVGRSFVGAVNTMLSMFMASNISLTMLKRNPLHKFPLNTTVDVETYFQFHLNENWYLWTRENGKNEKHFTPYFIWCFNENKSGQLCVYFPFIYIYGYSIDILVSKRFFNSFWHTDNGHFSFFSFIHSFVRSFVCSLFTFTLCYACSCSEWWASSINTHTHIYYIYAYTLR